MKPSIPLLTRAHFDALTTYVAYHTPTALQPAAKSTIQWLSDHLPASPFSSSSSSSNANSPVRTPSPLSPESHLRPRMESMSIPVLGEEAPMGREGMGERFREETDRNGLMDASGYIFGTKTKLYSNERERVASELSGLIYDDHFRPIGRYIKDMDPSKQRHKMGQRHSKKQAQERNILEDSVMFQPDLSESGWRQREELMEMWRTRPEKEIGARRRGFAYRVKDEDLNVQLADVSAFLPTLRGFELPARIDSLEEWGVHLAAEEERKEKEAQEQAGGAKKAKKELTSIQKSDHLLKTPKEKSRISKAALTVGGEVRFGGFRSPASAARPRDDISDDEELVFSPL